MDHQKLQHYLDLALQATLAASTQILNVYNSNDFQVESKGDNSPLTRADKNAHDAIAAILHSTDLPILSEEGRSIAYEERKNWKRFWMVDPLDGTKEFIKRNGEFTVNIALIEDQVPILGVVAVPATDEIFYGCAATGIFLKKGTQFTKLSRREPIDLKKKAIRVVASRSHMNEETQQFIDALTEPVLVSSGSSLKFMLLASGQADVYPRFAPTMEWDTAAAHAIVRELGITVREKGTGHELRYNKADLLNPYFICF